MRHTSFLSFVPFFPTSFYYYFCSFGFFRFLVSFFLFAVFWIVISRFVCVLVGTFSFLHDPAFGGLFTSHQCGRVCPVMFLLCMVISMFGLVGFFYFSRGCHLCVSLVSGFLRSFGIGFPVDCCQYAVFLCDVLFWFFAYRGWFGFFWVVGRFFARCQVVPVGSSGFFDGGLVADSIVWG